MIFRRIQILRGANIWARCTVMEVEVDLEGLPGATPAFADRLRSFLPSLPCDADLFTGVPIDLARALCRLALALQCLGGSKVETRFVEPMEQEGLFKVVIEYEEEEPGRAALDLARTLCVEALHDRPFDVNGELARLIELSQDVRLGPSTSAIVRAAQQKGIPVRRLNRGSLVQLGHGCLQRRIRTAETDRTSAIAEDVAQDKQLTRSLLQMVGVPVPDGRPVKDAEDAWQAAEELGLPVVVKPQDGNHGRGVATNLTTRDQVVRAFDAACQEGDSVMVERFIPGSDYRLLVVGERFVAAALREPAHVIGDGRSTITQLIDEVNRDPRRSDGHATVLSRIKLDPVALAVLCEQGHAPDSVPSAGTRVLIRRNGNLSTGGTATDVTDRVHPDVAARAVDAARAVGLDIAGVDVVALDISQPLESQNGAVVEVNASPGLRMHLEPSAGQPRAVGEAIVEFLFPGAQTGRIPLVAVTGVHGKTTTSRLLVHLLRGAGRVVGLACPDGLSIDGRRIAHDRSGPSIAGTVLLNPRLSAAVLETTRGGILSEGLGFDQCDVAVVTNIGQGDHLASSNANSLEELVKVKRTVVGAVATTGAAILNASDELAAALARDCAGSVIFFARDDSGSRVREHLQSGGRAVFVRAGVIVLAEGTNEKQLFGVSKVPLTHDGHGCQVENILAATGAAWALGIPKEAICSGLATFS
jgi:cyanophycin synthetase